MDPFVIILLATLTALVALPVGGIWCFRHQHQSAGETLFVLWIFLIAAIAARIAWARRKDASEKAARIAERQRNGLRPRSEIDQVVSHSEWKEEWTLHFNWHDWVEGERRILLPDDILLKWEWRTGPTSGAGGYAVERKGKIIAEIKLWIS